MKAVAGNAAAFLWTQKWPGAFEKASGRVDWADSTGGSAEKLDPAPGRDAEDHDIGDDERGALNDVVLGNGEHDRAENVPDLEEKQERGDGPDEAENDGKEGVHRKNPFWVRVRRARV